MTLAAIATAGEHKVDCKPRSCDTVKLFREKGEQPLEKLHFGGCRTGKAQQIPYMPGHNSKGYDTNYVRELRGIYTANEGEEVTFKDGESFNADNVFALTLRRPTNNGVPVKTNLYSDKGWPITGEVDVYVIQTTSPLGENNYVNLFCNPNGCVLDRALEEEVKVYDNIFQKTR